MESCKKDIRATWLLNVTLFEHSFCDKFILNHLLMALWPVTRGQTIHYYKIIIYKCIYIVNKRHLPNKFLPK